MVAILQQLFQRSVGMSVWESIIVRLWVEVYGIVNDFMRRGGQLYRIKYKVCSIIQQLNKSQQAMLANSNHSIDQSLFLSFPAIQFSYPTFIGYQQPITSIICQNQKKQRLNPSGQEQGKGKWTKNQQKTYIQFLINNKEEMSSKLARKSQKVFLKMSFLVKTRTADQCRSHHQKILKYQGSIDEIIRHYQQVKTNYEYSPSEVAHLDKKIEIRTGSTDEIFNENQFYTLNRKDNLFRIVVKEDYIPSFLQ